MFANMQRKCSPLAPNEKELQGLVLHMRMINVTTAHEPTHLQLLHRIRKSIHGGNAVETREGEAYLALIFSHRRNLSRG